MEARCTSTNVLCVWEALCTSHQCVLWKLLVYQPFVCVLFGFLVRLCAVCVHPFLSLPSNAKDSAEVLAVRRVEVGTWWGPLRTPRPNPPTIVGVASKVHLGPS